MASDQPTATPGPSLAALSTVAGGPLGLASLGASADPEQLEQLGPVIRSVTRTGKQDAFKAQLQSLTAKKETEMEKLCGAHQQEFTRAVDQLLTIRQNAIDLREEICFLNDQLQHRGRDLYTKKSELLNLRRVHRNIELATKAVAACQAVVAVADEVGRAIRGRQYYDALRGLHKLKDQHLPSVLAYSFGRHLQATLPALERQLRDAALQDMREWFSGVRTKSNQVGRELMESMAQRQEIWASRRQGRRQPTSDERSHSIDTSQDYVSTAVEFVLDEEVADPAPPAFDLHPLYQCIHIHDKLDHRKALKQSFEEDRRAQANQMTTRRFDFRLGSLEGLRGMLHDILGFFVLEHQILATTRDFRSKTEVDSLWDSVMTSCGDTLAQNVQDILGKQSILAAIRELLATFTYILEDYAYDTRRLKELHY
ncbi:Rab GTPase-binding exocyst subunit S15, partial [Dimargaris verticillata]